jgi:hypothetical protein
LEELAPESTRTIEIDEFVEREEIDPRYLIRPYYLRPDGKVGHDAFAVIREGRDRTCGADHTASTSPKTQSWQGEAPQIQCQNQYSPVPKSSANDTRRRRSRRGKYLRFA